MDSSAVSRTRAGQGVGAECVGLGLQTGRVHTRYGLTRPVGLEPIEPDINKLAGSVGPGCPAVPQRCHGAEQGAEFRGPPSGRGGTSDFQTWRAISAWRMGLAPLLIDLTMYFYVYVLYGYCC